MAPLLTEGARRALDLAARLATANSHDAVELRHVVWALALDESRAAELLAHHGITLDLLQEEIPLRTTSLETASTVTESAGPSPNAEPADALSHSDSMREAFHSARRIAAEAGRHAEVGTEHLLFGLTETRSEVAALLRRFGLDAAETGRRASELSGHPTHSLDVDFAITWQDRTEDEQVDTLRILDAAANRAREGLRVIEDYLRFSRDAAALARLAKELRHDLAVALGPLDRRGLIAARDTLHDVGTSVRTSTEQKRESPRDVLRANLKRAQEALRTLEEFGKVMSPVVAEEVSQIRYRAYTLEKAVLTSDTARQRLAGCSLYMLATEELCHHGAGPAIRGGIAGGVRIVQVREKSLPDGRLLEHARRVRKWTRELECLFIINDRPDLAVASDADGVHVGQDELPVREVRRIVGPHRLIGVSTHTIEQARQAVLDGADYLGVGPVFPSGTKSFDQLAGLDFVRQVAEEISLPWFAIGGIHADNLGEVIAAGARRIAVSGAICRAENPAAAAAELGRILGGHVSLVDPS